MVRIIAETGAEETDSSGSWPATGYSLGRHAGEEASPPTMTKTGAMLCWRSVLSHRMCAQSDVLTLSSGSVGSCSDNMGSVPFSVKETGDGLSRNSPRPNILISLFHSSIARWLSHDHRWLPSGDSMQIIRYFPTKVRKVELCKIHSFVCNFVRCSSRFLCAICLLTVVCNFVRYPDPSLSYGKGW
jgi:hypothetical protein